MPRTWHPLFHFIITPPVGGQREQQRLGEGKPPAPSRPASTRQNQSPPLPLPVSGWRLSWQDFSPSEHEFSPDSRLHHSGSRSRGRRKVACLPRPRPVQKEGTGWASRQPVRPTVPSICPTSLTPSCCLQPGPQSDPHSRTGRNRSCPRAARTTVISVFSHPVQDDTLESASSVGVGGVKQTVRCWGWEASRQTERILAIHILHWRLFNPDSAKGVEAENTIQNPFSWARSLGF